MTKNVSCYYSVTWKGTKDSLVSFFRIFLFDSSSCLSCHFKVVTAIGICTSHCPGVISSFQPEMGPMWPSSLSLCLVPSPDFSFHADEYLEVYVSASEHPNHFWIQIVGSRSLQLDKLVNEMTQHYENSVVSCHRDRAGV